MLSDYAVNLPAVWCARKGKIAGYDGSSMYESEKNNLTLMNIDVKATWDEMGNNISVTTEVEPCANPEEGATYAVGYVLTASGLKNCNKLIIVTTCAIPIKMHRPKWTSSVTLQTMWAIISL